MSAATSLSKVLNRDEIGQLYIALMGQILSRLNAVADSIPEVISDQENAHNWKNLEFSYLQVRKICELTALSVLAAHSELGQFSSKDFRKEWQASTLFEKLAKLNPHAFPIPVVTVRDGNGLGNHQIIPQSNILSAKDIRDIYGLCGDRLHVGSLKRILEGKIPDLQPWQIVEWHNQFVKLLENHVILLPEIKSVMLVVLKDAEDEQIHCAFGDADGPAMLTEPLKVANFAVVEKL